VYILSAAVLYSAACDITHTEWHTAIYVSYEAEASVVASVSS
jgi:hypothetical protein